MSDQIHTPTLTDTCDMTVPTKVWPSSDGGITFNGVHRCGRIAVATVKHGESSLRLCSEHWLGQKQYKPENWISTEPK